MVRIIEKGLDGWKRLVLAVSGLKVYEGVLFDNAMEQVLLILSGALFVNFVVDAASWSSAAYYAVGVKTLAGLMGLTIARGIYLFDKSWILTDTSALTWWQKLSGYAFRFLVALILAVFTCVPWETWILEPDINAELNRQEMVMRRDRIEELRTQAADDSNIVVTTVREDRAPKRDSLLAKHEATRQTLQARVDQFAREYLDENAGMGRSKTTGKGKGEGPVAKAAKKNQVDAQADLDTFEARASSEVDAFDQKTEEKIEAALRESKERRNMIEKEAGGESISEDAAAKYGLPTISRGFMTRWSALNDLSEKNERVHWVRIGLFVLMIAISLMPIGIKLVSGRKLRRYLAEGAEAEGGNAGAIGSLKSDGVDSTLFHRLSMNESGRNTLFDLHKARRDLCRELAMFWRQVELYCREVDEFGQHHTLHALQHKVMGTWMSGVFGKWEKVRELQDDLNNMGHLTPAWDPDLPYGEPKGATPWTLSADVFKGIGWVEPNLDVAALACLIPEKAPPDMDQTVWTNARRAVIRLHGHGGIPLSEVKPPPTVTTPAPPKPTADQDPAVEEPTDPTITPETAPAPTEEEATVGLTGTQRFVRWVRGATKGRRS